MHLFNGAFTVVVVFFFTSFLDEMFESVWFCSGEAFSQSGDYSGIDFGFRGGHAVEEILPREGREGVETRGEKGDRNVKLGTSSEHYFLREVQQLVHLVERF